MIVMKLFFYKKNFNLYWICVLFFTLISCSENKDNDNLKQQKYEKVNNKYFEKLSFSDVREIKFSYTTFVDREQGSNIQHNIPINKNVKKEIFYCFQKSVEFPKYHIPKCMNPDSSIYLLELNLLNGKKSLYEMSHCLALTEKNDDYVLHYDEQCYNLLIKLYKEHANKQE